MLSAQELHLDWENIWFSYNVTGSLFFFLLDFVKKTFVFIANPYFRRVSCWWNAHLCANAIICIVPGTFFSRMWLWGGLKCVTVVKLFFCILVFTFVASFLVLVFWPPFGQKWGSSSILLFFEKAGANFAPSRGWSPGSVFMSKTFALLWEFDVFS